MTNLKKLLRYPGYLLLPFILLFALFFYFATIKPTWQLITYQRESATIVSCASSISRSSTRYAPVVQTASGILITGKVFASNSACVGQINDKVTVLVNPKNKNEGVIFTLGQFGVLPLALMIFLAIFLYARHINQARNLK